MSLKRMIKAAKGSANGQKGSIGDLLSVGLCILAMVAITHAFMGCVALVNKKTAVSQTARNYILRMETVGYLTAADEERLRRDLEVAGITDLALEGTTREPSSYGTEITLRIAGRIGGQAFEEKRVSTAKH